MMQEQIQKIVVAVDNSRFSLTAVEWGAHLAMESRASLTLVHALETRYLREAFFAEFSSAIGVVPVEHAIENYKNAFWERGQNILAAGEEICRKIGAKVECKLVEGIFYEVIKDTTKGANLLILGRRGDHANLGFHLLGAEGERVIRHVKCTCLVVPDRYHFPENLIVGVHESEPSRAAIRWGKYFHQAYPSARLRFIHVPESKENGDSRPIIDDKGSEHNIETISGNPEQVLIDVCSQNSEKTLCLIGATGHKRSLKELILGTVSYHLLHKVKGAVLLARPG